MNIKQLYTNCLAQGAYYISNNGEAAIVDPLRETKPYLDLLKQNGDTLKYIFETHFHADFVSGHVDLAKETGATIVFGPNAQTEYKSHIAADGEEFKIGNLTLKVMHTPGHTLESSTYLLQNETKKPLCIFTGDTLFIGDVGRPDLAIKSELTQEDLAGMLYDSLRNKIMPLPDDVIVYPAHGAGSACGKNMSKETFDTLGSQKQLNYALRDISKAEFITELTTGILPAPQYFTKNAALNKNGYQNYSEILKKGSNALSVEDFETAMKTPNVIVLDVRKPQEFANGHIPNSLFIGLDGQFAPWVGTVILDINAPILLITPEGREEETVMRLSRVGYDNCIGYLKGGMSNWKNASKKIEQIKSIPAEEFITHYKTGHKTLDVRKPGEFESAHLKNAVTKPLDFIYDWVDVVDKSHPYMIHCAGGYRSMIAASILKAKGFTNLTDVQGGYGAISKLEASQKEIETLACTKSL
ncbi:MBL fold metallo-hydrolase [Aurantibacillus circumpalustris]|uniref:MBL fold metallo-hydrolase n=1 Tax=Aurantibacillus circumpalustris TaxID=3036359 RepID=UPI00295A7B0D|nr:MBL fold metallo-hydrolase [Aurantibacillus circumpalustris]